MLVQEELRRCRVHGFECCRGQYFSRRAEADRVFVRWSRLFGQFFRVLKWKSHSVSGRGGGNVKIGFIDFQGLWEGRKTVVSFSGLSINRHFHGLLPWRVMPPVVPAVG